jgi:hypothetical protein
MNFTRWLIVIFVGIIAITDIVIASWLGPAATISVQITER